MTTTAPIDADRWLTGKWIQTYSGARFSLDAPRAEDVHIKDIAHALSMLCRFTGHVKRFYSVAEHSVLVSRLLKDAGYPVEVRFAGLMHDAAEAYVADINRPLKSMLPDYKVIELGVWAAIAEKFGLAADDLAGPVKWADNVALFMERRDLMTVPPGEWDDENEYVDAMRPWPVSAWVPEHAKSVFRHFYDDLERRRA